MELLWEYTFPVISLGSHVTLQKGNENLVGVAIADYPDMPPSIPFILIGGRKMFSLSTISSHKTNFVFRDGSQEKTGHYFFYVCFSRVWQSISSYL